MTQEHSFLFAILAEDKPHASISSLVRVEENTKGSFIHSSWRQGFGSSSTLHLLIVPNGEKKKNSTSIRSQPDTLRLQSLQSRHFLRVRDTGMNASWFICSGLWTLSDRFFALSVTEWLWQHYYSTDDDSSLGRQLFPAMTVGGTDSVFSKLPLILRISDLVYGCCWHIWELNRASLYM